VERKGIAFAELLAEAMSEPGIISEAYTRFHSYSMGNAMAAFFQCKARNLPLGPIATFPRWKELGRHVKRGERAIMLCMPITCKRAAEASDAEPEADGRPFTRFVWRPNWFVLAQTDGADYAADVSLPEWDAERALAALAIERTPFDMMDGNCQGFARKRSVAVSPVAENPRKTLVHEMAHVLLGHTEVSECSDAGDLTRSDREVEAEGTAYIVCSVLGAPGLEKSRGYIQSWLAGGHVSERSAARIFKAADQILKAGRPVAA
jgi:antirestriction protein ArdC